MDLFGKKKIRKLEDKVEILSDSIDVIARGHKYERSEYSDKILRCWDKTKTYSTESIKDLTIQEFFDFYFDGKPIKRKEEVDVEYRKGE